MDTIIQIIIIIAVILYAINLFKPVKGVENITVQQAKSRIKNKEIQYIDVRTPMEYKAHHKKPFKNIPLADLKKRIDELDQNKEVVVICQSGMRSMKAAKILSKKGFNKINNVKGGMNAWT